MIIVECATKHPAKFQQETFVATNHNALVVAIALKTNLYSKKTLEHATIQSLFDCNFPISLVGFSLARVVVAGC